MAHVWVTRYVRRSELSTKYKISVLFLKIATDPMNRVMRPPHSTDVSFIQKPKISNTGPGGCNSGVGHSFQHLPSDLHNQLTNVPQTSDDSSAILWHPFVSKFRKSGNVLLEIKIPPRCQVDSFQFFFKKRKLKDFGGLWPVGQC